MMEYKPSKEAEETVKVFDRLERWLRVERRIPEPGTAIPTDFPADNAWGEPLPISFEVPDQPIDLDSITAMRGSAAQSQGQAQTPGPSGSKPRPQTRQEGI
jgi:hypothetical protein